MAITNTPRPRVQCQCEFCGAVFSVKYSNLRLGKVKGRFCSQGCYRKGLQTLEERFWALVQKGDDCWEWIGNTTKDGYGRMKRTGESAGTYVHRISWEFHFGAIPAGLKVLHHCDNPPCVNPKHLFLGTDKDNSDDKMRKGRHVASPGEKNGSSRLSKSDVVAIRTRHKNGERQSVLSREFKVSDVTISRIVRRLNWQSVQL